MDKLSSDEAEKGAEEDTQRATVSNDPTPEHLASQPHDIQPPPALLSPTPYLLARFSLILKSHLFRLVFSVRSAVAE